MNEHEIKTYNLMIYNYFNNKMTAACPPNSGPRMAVKAADIGNAE